MFATTPFGATAFAGGGTSGAQAHGWYLVVTDAPDLVSARVGVTDRTTLAAIDAADSVGAQVFVGAIPTIASLAIQDAPDVVTSIFLAPQVVHLSLAVADAADSVFASALCVRFVQISAAVQDVPDRVQAVTTSGRVVYGALPHCRPSHRQSHKRPPNLQCRC